MKRIIAAVAIAVLASAPIQSALASIFADVYLCDLPTYSPPPAHCGPKGETIGLGKAFVTQRWYVVLFNLNGNSPDRRD